MVKGHTDSGYQNCNINSALLGFKVHVHSSLLWLYIEGRIPVFLVTCLKQIRTLLSCYKTGWDLIVSSVQFSSVQLLSHVWLSATPWTAACQASLYITNSWSLLKLMSIESVMPSSRLILCHPLCLLPSIFPSIRIFSNESVIHIRWPNTVASASTSVLPMNIQDWRPLGLTGLISLQSKGLSRVFSNTTVQKHQFFGSQLSL